MPRGATPWPTPGTTTATMPQVGSVSRGALVCMQSCIMALHSPWGQGRAGLRQRSLVCKLLVCTCEPLVCDSTACLQRRASRPSVCSRPGGGAGPGRCRHGCTAGGGGDVRSGDGRNWWSCVPAILGRAQRSWAAPLARHSMDDWWRAFCARPKRRLHMRCCVARVMFQRSNKRVCLPLPSCCAAAASRRR